MMQMYAQYYSALSINTFSEMPKDIIVFKSVMYINKIAGVIYKNKINPQ